MGVKTGSTFTRASEADPVVIVSASGAPMGGPSGVTTVSGALASDTATDPFTPTAERTAYLELTGTGSATVTLVYECNDGATYAPNSVGTDGGAPIILGKVAYAGAATRLSFETTIFGQKVKALPGTVTGTVNFAFRQ